MKKGADPMKRLAALFFTLALLLIPTSAHEAEQIYTFPIQFNALASDNSAGALLSLPQNGVFDPGVPTYGSQLRDDPLAMSAYSLLEEQLAPGVTELTLDVSGYDLSAENLSTEIVCSLNAAVAAFVYDHPESQHCTIAQYGYAVAGEQITKLLYLITPRPNAAEEKAALDAYVSDFAAGFDRTLPTVEQYRIIHDQVCRVASYDNEAAAAGVASDAHTAYGALVLDNMAVCEGYAKAFKVLCDAVDLPCMLIAGEADQHGNFYGFSNHMWNAVRVEESWYAVDTTWDDETMVYNINNLSIAATQYDYFLNNAPFDMTSPGHDHRASGNIYFASDFPMTFALPQLAPGAHPDAAGLRPSEGSITFRSGEFAFPEGLWDVNFDDGFTPGALTTITLKTENTPSAAAPLNLPADRAFLWSLDDGSVRRAEGFTGPIFSVSGSLTLDGDLRDSGLFSMTDTAAVTLTGDLLTGTFVMDRGSLYVRGELLSCVDYNGGTLTVNGEVLTTDYHHRDIDGSCPCGAYTDSSEGILSLSSDSISLRAGESVTDILVCVTAYDNGRMTGLHFQRVSPVPGQLLTLSHTVSGSTTAAYILRPDTFAPLYSTK